MKFKIFLINLDTSKERLKVCRSEFEKYNIEFERVSGVYGKDLTSGQINDIYDQELNEKRYKNSLSLGEIGCYLSHKLCWQKIVDENLDYAIILEDDFILMESFGDFKIILERLTDWDYVRIAFSSRNVPIVNRTPVTEKYDLVHYAKVPINTMGQAVSLQGAQKLLNDSHKIYRPVDVDMKHYWEKGIEVIGIDPPLIQEQNYFTSEIGQIANGLGREGKGSLLRRVKYAIKHAFNRAYHNQLRTPLNRFIKSN